MRPTFRVIAVLSAAALLLWTIHSVAPDPGMLTSEVCAALSKTDDSLPEKSILQARRHNISSAFQHAWDGYLTHCMGRDSIHPVSNTCDDDFGGWGATAIDALSTAIMLEKADVVDQILRFIATIDFTVVKGGTKI